MFVRLILIIAASFFALFPWLDHLDRIVAQERTLVGQAAFGDWRADAPGVRRRISASDMPRPNATPSVGNPPRIVAKPASAQLKAPPGFHVEPIAMGLDNPRAVRVAPNGDIFFAETGPGLIRILRARAGKSEAPVIFAAGLSRPFGLAFYPQGSDPQWLYVANTNSIVRFRYRAGDIKSTEPPQVVVPDLPYGSGHFTRDIAFSRDGKKMFVSVGSRSNDGEDMPKRGVEDASRWDRERGLGAAWGPETERAAVLVFDADGTNRRIFATGLRNCVGIAVDPRSGEPWCSVNERDGFGDDLVPDYVTRVREGAFYGWPWYYIGPNEDPRHRGERPDLAGKVSVPDVLVQSHSASLQMTFYDAMQFPPDYRGDAFAAEHGSWNRAKRTGYKVIRIIMKDGVPTGDYEDFLTGFVVNDMAVWGRPVGVGVATDGSLVVSEDGNGTVWRIWYDGKSD